MNKLHSIWIAALKIYAGWKTRRSVWFKARRIEVFRELRPGADQLFDAEVDLLGELFAMPHYRALLKYLNIERWSAINNGLVQAKDPREMGEVQGDIGRCNKLESDMYQFHEDMIARNQKKPAQDALEDTGEEEQAGDV